VAALLAVLAEPETAAALGGLGFAPTAGDAARAGLR
jgi:hypothetical protein